MENAVVHCNGGYRFRSNFLREIAANALNDGVKVREGVQDSDAELTKADEAYHKYLDSVFGKMQGEYFHEQDALDSLVALLRAEERQYGFEDGMRAGARLVYELFISPKEREGL